MSLNRNLTCIICPKGCQLTVSFNSAGEIEKIEGNACKRGAEYAVNECTHPMRTITSTMRTADGYIVPVKTSSSVAKEKMFEVMAKINKTLASSDVKIGSVAISNVAGTEADVVVTGNKSK